MLDAAFAVRRDGFGLDVTVAGEAGDVVAVLGPNGAGKSTLLQALAGVVAATGTAVLDGTDLLGQPPARRPVAWVPQDGALFPHLSALDNVAFGLGGRRGRQEASEWLGRLGVAAVADRRPGAMSGGQAQKVALARALARAPRLLLLDEPLASVDASARSELRSSLRQHLAGFDGITLLVTHDPVDALALAGRVLALDGGRVVQDAPTSTVVAAPRTRWLAELMGANAYDGTRRGDVIELATGGHLVVAADDAATGAVLAVVAAHAVALHRSEPAGSARNHWPVVVQELVALGSRVRVRCSGRPDVTAEVTPQAVAELGLAEGERVWAAVKATEVAVVER
jgi:molybdate transport system permease protein